MIKLILFSLLLGLAVCGFFDNIKKTGEARKQTIEDLKRTPEELIESRGLKGAHYKVHTKDKYINTLYRIINPYWTDPLKGPLLLQHGLNGNMMHWMENTPGKVYPNGTYIEVNGIITDCDGKNVKQVGNTLGIVLAACGYDVWLANNRGTKFSTEHEKYNCERDLFYWQYSIDDLEADDIANIDFIRNETKSETVGYIGHSLGTAQMFQVLSDPQYAEYNDIVKPFIALAPVAYLGHVQGLLGFALKLEPLIRLNDGPAYLLPPKELGVLDKAISNVCEMPGIDRLCETFFFAVSGVNYEANDREKFGARVAPDGTSFRVFAQLARRANFGNLAKYDHGLLNYKYYGQLTPPSFNLSKITSNNVILISATNDLLADVTDVQRIRDEMKDHIYFDYIVPDIKYQHGDVIWANNAGRMVNWMVLKLLQHFF